MIDRREIVFAAVAACFGFSAWEEMKIGERDGDPGQRDVSLRDTVAGPRLPCRGLSDRETAGGLWATDGTQMGKDAVSQRMVWRERYQDRPYFRPRVMVGRRNRAGTQTLIAECFGPRLLVAPYGDDDGRKNLVAK